MGEAVQSKLELSQVERLYVQNALNRYVDSLERSLSKEVAGSEIHALRRREIEAVEALRRKVS